MLGIRLRLSASLLLPALPAALLAQAPEQEAVARITLNADAVPKAPLTVPPGAVMIDRDGRVLLTENGMGRACAPPRAAPSTALRFVEVRDEAQTDFCWSTTWGRGVGTVPGTCAPGQEKNGLLCYERCQDGYVSNGVAGCIQTCPQGGTDDGLFCGWPSYKVKEYPAWDRAKCERNHPEGCWQTVPTIGLWVENCRTGYRHILGFCEKIEIDCAGMGLMPGRIANSCAKRTYGRAAQLPGCGSKEYDAGLCYESCGPTADGVGPVCWGQGPPGWVPCGAGWAKDGSTCNQHVTDQVLSIVDAVASTAFLALTLGSSAAASTAGKAVGTVSRTAARGVKSVSKATAKKVLAEYALNTGATLGADVANGGIDMIWQVGDIQGDSTMTEVEKQHAIAQLALSNISLLDPTGITGVVAAYTKPICKDIGAMNQVAAADADTSGPSGALAEIMEEPEAIERGIEQRVSVGEQEVRAASEQLEQAEARLARARGQPPEARQDLQRAVDAARGQLDAVRSHHVEAARALGEFRAMKPRFAQALVAADAAARPSWTRLDGGATDIGVGNDGTAWVIGGAGVIYRRGARDGAWTNLGGKGVRIASGLGAEGWVVNELGQLWLWADGSWGMVCPEPAHQAQGGCRGVGKIVDVGAAADGGVWVVNDQGGLFRGTPRRGEVATFTPEGPGGAVRLAAASADVAYIVDERGRVSRVEPGGTTDVGTGVAPGSPPFGLARDVAFGSGDRIWVVTDGGIVLTKRLVPPGGWSLPSAGGTAPADAIAVGAGGSVGVVERSAAISRLDRAP